MWDGQLAQELLVARADDAWGTGLEERPSYVVVAATAGIGIEPTVRQKKVGVPTRLLVVIVNIKIPQLQS
ncbi:hypothetical protein BVRB_9g212430 [Beta vulgaris subsp. vulgaris]|nr:hypothetical protein BVRB_9g212430 [Beta vulgaris subsp. vulgaris]